jgi:hypothetical protein
MFCAEKVVRASNSNPITNVELTLGGLRSDMDTTRNRFEAVWETEVIIASRKAG